MALWLSATLPPHFQRRQKLITKSIMGFFLNSLFIHSFFLYKEQVSNSFYLTSLVQLLEINRLVFCKINFNSQTLDVAALL